MTKNKKGFTLVELLAVIAILAIILLIAVPQILGVIDDAKKDSFKNSARSVFRAAELVYIKDSSVTTGTIASLALSGKPLTGDWKAVVENGKLIIKLVNVCDTEFCAKPKNYTSGAYEISSDKQADADIEVINKPGTLPTNS